MDGEQEFGGHSDGGGDGGDFLTFGVLSELALGAAAFVLAAVFGGNPVGDYGQNWLDAGVAGRQIALGLVATLPLLGMFWVLDRLPWQALNSIEELLSTHLLSRLRHANWTGVLALAMAAGFGEELLFRGWLQPRIVQAVGYPYGVVTAIVVASCLFGICHWMNAMYAALAALIGLYLGLLAEWSGGFLAGAVAHSLYDFIVLWLLLHRDQQ